MRTGWMKLGAFGVAMAGTGAVATVFLLEGEASARTAAGEEVHLAAGDRWREGSAPVRRGAGSAATPSAPSDQGDARRVAVAEAEAARLRTELEEVKRQLKFQTTVAQGLHPTVDPSKPLPWPEAMPAQHRPEGFHEVLRAATAACPNLAGMVDSTECNEPPCILALKASPDAGNLYQAVVDCAPWAAAYGRGVSMVSKSGACDGGSGPTTAFVSPYWDGWEDGDPAQAMAMQKHLEARFTALQDRLPKCE